MDRLDRERPSSIAPSLAKTPISDVNPGMLSVASKREREAFAKKLETAHPELFAGMDVLRSFGVSRIDAVAKEHEVRLLRLHDAALAGRYGGVTQKVLELHADRASRPDRLHALERAEAVRDRLAKDVDMHSSRGLLREDVAAGELEHDEAELAALERAIADFHRAERDIVARLSPEDRSFYDRLQGERAELLEERAELDARRYPASEPGSQKRRKEARERLEEIRFRIETLEVGLTSIEDDAQEDKAVLSAIRQTKLEDASWSTLTTLSELADWLQDSKMGTEESREEYRRAVVAIRAEKERRYRALPPARKDVYVQLEMRHKRSTEREDVMRVRLVERNFDREFPAY